MNREKNTSGFIAEACDTVLNGGTINRRQAQRLISMQEQPDIMLLIAHANRLRHHYCETDISMCSIVNARSGKCTEDCAFCAQSSRFDTNIKTHPMLETNDILRCARRSKKYGARYFSIVTSGKGITDARELQHICEAINKISSVEGLKPCASLGIVTKEQLVQLRDAGLKRYHHNLETAERFFPSVCTTHSFSRRAETIHEAKEAGLEVCAGGIFGLGETPEDRIEMAYELKAIDVDSVPLNFLNPIPGTALEHMTQLPPIEIVKTVAVYRFLLPQKEIRICGGREVNLRTLQPLIYIAGASGIMAGNYLTTAGRNASVDIQEIADLGLCVQ
ncbi:MAG: biotin synthase BioB [Chitinivibrionales bacterium]|nr:biotin synthase BioB [Chitinivibrionales bacterium]